MSDQSSQINALQDAIIERAQQLAQEHINEGNLTRNRIIRDAREKVKLMEQKELLAAKDNAEREYHRLVQANELRLQSELDQNRWGIVQSVMDVVVQRIAEFAENGAEYEPVLFQLLKNGVEVINQTHVVAQMNHRDYHKYVETWPRFVADLDAEIELSKDYCECSGGVRLITQDGNTMVDNTFEGVLSRRQDELMRLIFERLFSQVQGIGVKTHG